MSVTLKINGETRTLDADPESPLLWALRDELGMTGTKFGCGIASCGACTVHMDGVPIRSCQTFVGDLEGAEITTIEGIDGKAATALLAETPKPTDEDIDAAMDGNVCRCATYARIRKAIHLAADKMEA
jgi:isoquinoline 1-oxidoreductase alpha subunit